MQYALLIYSNEADEPNPATEAGQKHFQGYMEFTQDIREKGLFVSGEPLTPVATATTVRVRNGKAETTDGPFAETKEQLGGFYIVDCDDLDQAIAIAARIPSAAIGSVEIRPIMMLDGSGG